MVNERRQRVIDELLNDDPDLPNDTAPYEMWPDDVDRLVDLDRHISWLVRQGTFPQSTGLTLMRTANRAASWFVRSKIRLMNVLSHFVQAADHGLLQEGVHWVRPKPDVIAFHTATALPVLREYGLTKVSERDLCRLLQVGGVYRADLIVATRERITFGVRDRRRAFVLRDARLRSAPNAKMSPVLIRKGPHRGRTVPDDLSLEALTGNR